MQTTIALGQIYTKTAQLKFYKVSFVKRESKFGKNLMISWPLTVDTQGLVYGFSPDLVKSILFILPLPFDSKSKAQKEESTEKRG